MKVGLFFGSFNPVHTGHLIIANHIASNTSLDEVWFVVSPQNPFKEKASLLSQYDRLHLVNLAIENNPKLRASDIEFKLPTPSYTIDTLTFLKDKYKQHTFSLIMGADNLTNLHKWKNADILLRDYPIYVYSRPDAVKPKVDLKGDIQFLDAPLLSISATFIRTQIKEGKSIKYLVPEKVENYILESNFYS